ncbi:MAG: hypothetical protein KF729_18780 [Sandaracinaceae bacterium]|nr:hypothetical protein [Sandaracinaceae bacterium]
MTLCCAWCGSPMRYVHGHAACVAGRCPMFGVNQSECCQGEVCVPPTAAVGRAPHAPPASAERACADGDAEPRYSAGPRRGQSA